MTGTKKKPKQTLVYITETVQELLKQTIFFLLKTRPRTAIYFSLIINDVTLRLCKPHNITLHGLPTIYTALIIKII